MPQLQIIEPQQGSVQVQPASREQFGRGGEAFMALSQQMAQYTQALDNVSKQRAEAAAGEVDTKLRVLNQEMQANPNGLIGDAWKAEYDKRAAAIRDEAAKTPFIHQGVFGQKTKTATDVHKLEMTSASTQITLASGKTAFESVLTKLADDYSRTDDPDERRLVQAQMEIAVHGAAADGIIMPTERTAYILQAKNEGYVSAFARLNNENPENALRFVVENEANLPVKQAEALKEKAINEIMARTTLALSQERAVRARTKEAQRQANVAANTDLMQQAVTGGVDLSTILSYSENLDTSGQHFWMNFYMKNPNGQAPRPEKSDPTTIRQYQLEIRGLDGLDPVKAGEKRATVLTRLSQDHAAGLLTDNDYDTFLNKVETRETHPLISLVNQIIQDATLLDADKKAAGFQASMDAEAYIRKNVNKPKAELWEGVQGILDQYDLYDIRTRQLGKAPYYIFDSSDETSFSYEKSKQTVMREYKTGKIDEPTAKKRLAELEKYNAYLESTRVK